MPKLNRLMFREYDIRGKLTDDELNKDSIRLIGLGFGAFLQKRGIKDVILGHDYRSYSKSVKNNMRKGLLSSGCNVIDIGMVLVPMLYAAQYYLKKEGGVMITASHNPDGWTGFKLAHGYSKTLKADELNELYEIIESGLFVHGKGKLSRKDISEQYAKDLVSRIHLKRPITVVMDCGNGTAGAFAPKIFKEAGCEVVELFCNLDYTFPNHFPNPELQQGRDKVAEEVLKNKADIGILFDGDGDRMGVVDDKGNTIWADRILILLARQLLKKKPGAKIVFDVKCTQALGEDIKAHGGIPIMWKTGHSWIKSKLHEEKADLAGERSGHIFFVDNYYGFDDGVFAGLRLVEYLSELPHGLSEELATTPQYIISPTIHVDCPDDKKYRVVEKLVDEFKRDYKVIDINGARVLFPEGWGLVRASSNEPVLVLVFEAKTQEALEKYKKIFKEKFAKYPEISKVWKNE
jgi:phosphomannomutase/phosphoglucomutase